MPLSLSVVMFAYNEADNIGPVVSETLAGLDARLGDTLSDYQLILVDDGRFRMFLSRGLRYVMRFVLGAKRIARVLAEVIKLRLHFVKETIGRG